MCLSAYFYDLSERQVEIYINENTPAKYFVGLGLDQAAPDHSTLSRFREQLTQQGDLEIFEQLLAEIVQIAAKSGIQLGAFTWLTVFTVKPTLIVPKTINEKRMGKDLTIRMQCGGQGQTTGQESKRSKCESSEILLYFCGYKGHVSLNAESNLIASLEVTPGEANDGHPFCSLVDQDLAKKRPIQTYTADRGYDDGHNHFY